MAYQSIHFTDAELECKCGCHQNGCTDELKQALDKLRDLAGVPITVDDGFRCAAHNAAVGGVPHSEHPMGLAADIKIGNLGLQAMYDLAVQIEEFNMGGIGVYDGEPFIHVDTREHGPARWARVNGKYVAITELLQ